MNPESMKTNNSIAKKDEVLEKRKKFSSATQSVTYGNPLMIMRGDGARLYDENDIGYLDTRNNVGHIGWQNKRWQKAIVEQLAQTNTNTRYLHPKMVELQEKLLNKFPPYLRNGGKVFFTNSGSEANELALRLAKAYTKKQGVITMDNAYHGWTSATVGISPYKKYGILDVKPRVFCVPCPDTFAGEFRLYKGGSNTEEQAATHYSEKVRQIIQEMEGNISCFFMESGMGVGGVIVPPKGFMSKTFDIVRSAGGVCVCDEVQTGFGRVGSHFWAFEVDGTGACPDIVTMGKPFGNGFPIGAVVCTGAVNAAFENLNMEFFSTFGGNPVACAAGLAVLRIIEEDELQQHALRIGNFLKKKLEELKQSAHPRDRLLIGDIRGSGLFLGVEFVRRFHEGGSPVLPEEVPVAAGPETYAVQDRLVSKYNILTNVDGPRHNVIVIKPPMVFSESDAAYFVVCLAEAMKYVQAPKM